MKIARVCIYCGSSAGTHPAHRVAAAELGTALAQAGIGVVYGGASVGLMGEVANAALAAGGEVTGVIPKSLVDRELAHTSLTKLEITASMHERKARMAELSDAFVALPGGVGTMEEIFEVWTWAQLGIHEKPCALFDVAGYYHHLVQFLDHQHNEGFVRDRHRKMLILASSPAELIARLEGYEAPEVKKWLGAQEI